ncbi:MAG TPA: hypothetical protein VII45_07240 [Solirubrobacterales bacterium]
MGEALDADFISHLDRLTVDDLERLKADYGAFADDCAALQPAAGEFWPVNHRLIPKEALERSQKFADTAAQRAMSQLLYAHGAVVPDRLGLLLTLAVNPEHSWSKKPQWETRGAADLGNYLEALAFLRPLVDAGLLMLQPRTVRAIGFFPSKDIFFTDTHRKFGEPDLSAIEFELGRDARRKFEEAIKAGGLFTYGSVLGPYDPSKLWETTDAFEFLFRKFTDLAKGFPGHLNLESRQEREVFAWLVERERPTSPVHPETENLSIADSLTAPALSDLQPADVVAMHQSDAWSEYRLALRRGLDRVSGLDDLSREEALAVVREEMRVIEQSATRTNRRSRFVEARANAGRDLVIGAVVAAGAAPIIGPSSAAVGLTMGTARTASALLWSWFRSGDEEDERAIARCFGALG